MAILSPTGDPASDKKLWWRCVFIAAAAQPVLVLLDLIFRLTFFRTILTIPYYPFIKPFFNNVWHSVEHADGASAISQVAGFFALLPVCFVLNSLVLGTIFYLGYWLCEKDFDLFWCALSCGKPPENRLSRFLSFRGKPSMKLPYSNSFYVNDFFQWFVCIVDVMCIQILILAVSDIVSTKCLTWILGLFYAPLIILLGMVFEDQMFLGNIPFGLALLFMSMMIVSVVFGTVFYFGNKLYGKYMPRKNKQE